MHLNLPLRKDIALDRLNVRYDLLDFEAVLVDDLVASFDLPHNLRFYLS